MNETSYSPGLHKLLTLKVEDLSKLTSAINFSDFTDTLLSEFGLEKVGYSSFTFDNSSFTSAICLMESHICIHTWPEFGQLTMDIYLCNYLQDNSSKVQAVADRYVSYFNAEIIKQSDIYR